MKIFRYSLVFFIGGLIVLSAGCAKEHVSVINTESAIVIKSKDSVEKQKPKTHVNGRLIKMGESSSDSGFGPSFDIDKLN